MKNKANNAIFFDGNYWTYNSSKAFTELFPYASQRTISRALHHLKDEGLIIFGNYNKSPYDRTTWYAITEKGNSILQKKEFHLPDCQMENSDVSNQSPENVQPIPDIISDINTDIKPDVLTVSKDTVRQTETVRRIIAAWNKLEHYGIKPISRVSSGSKRYTYLIARLGEYGEVEVLKAIDNIKSSKFLQGKSGGKKTG